jgi:hypothetical protein
MRQLEYGDLSLLKIDNKVMDSPKNSGQMKIGNKFEANSSLLSPLTSVNECLNSSAKNNPTYLPNS